MDELLTLIVVIHNLAPTWRQVWEAVRNEIGYVRVYWWRIDGARHYQAREMNYGVLLPQRDTYVTVGYKWRKKRRTCDYCGAAIPNDTYRSDEKQMLEVWIRLGKPNAWACTHFCLCCKQRLTRPLSATRRRTLNGVIQRFIETEKEVN